MRNASPFSPLLAEKKKFALRSFSYVHHFLKIVFPLKKNEEGFRKQMKNEMSHRLKSADDSCGYDLLASFESIFVGNSAEPYLY